MEIINEILHSFVNTKPSKPRVYFHLNLDYPRVFLTTLMLVATASDSRPKTNQQQRPSDHCGRAHSASHSGDQGRAI